MNEDIKDIYRNVLIRGLKIENYYGIRDCWTLSEYEEVILYFPEIHTKIIL
jgi:hypothetical protein